MASRGVNKVILVGNLGNDPEIRYMPNGGAVANITIATSESWRDKATGEQREKTEWHRAFLFGKLAEVAGEYLRKGSQVYIEGQLQTRKWQDQSGQDRYTTEVVVQGFNGVMCKCLVAVLKVVLLLKVVRVTTNSKVVGVSHSSHNSHNSSSNNTVLQLNSSQKHQQQAPQQAQLNIMSRQWILMMTSHFKSCF